jgi:hypothetical protein
MTSRPQSGEDILAGVPDAETRTGAPLSIFPKFFRSLSPLDQQLLGPCDLACGACAHCRAFDSIHTQLVA